MYTPKFSIVMKMKYHEVHCHITGPLCGEATDDGYSFITQKASNAQMGTPIMNQLAYAQSVPGHHGDLTMTPHYWPAVSGINFQWTPLTKHQ